jgi:methyl coenzyme M reductase subunit C-like uncharacterized protein (methanogenesis marker protein 7)
MIPIFTRGYPGIRMYQGNDPLWNIEFELQMESDNEAMMEMNRQYNELSYELRRLIGEKPKSVPNEKINEEIEDEKK